MTKEERQAERVANKIVKAFIDYETKCTLVTPEQLEDALNMSVVSLKAPQGVKNVIETIITYYNE